MKPTIESLSVTFVKNQFAEGQVMELIACLSDGQILQKTIPVDGRIVRLDADFFLPKSEPMEVDGA